MKLNDIKNAILEKKYNDLLAMAKHNKEKADKFEREADELLRKSRK